MMVAMTTYIPVEGGPSPADLPPAGSITPRQHQPVSPPLRPMQSLLAAATRLTSESLGRARGRGVGSSAEGWQEDAWEMYDLVGELRFVTNLLANQASKARFYVGTLPDNPDDPPIPTTDQRLIDALEAVGDGPSGLTQLAKRLFVNLQIPGDVWLVGIPRDLLPDADPDLIIVRNAEGLVNLDDLVWHTFSVTEVKFSGRTEVELNVGAGETIKASPDDLWMIRTWNPHPRRFWEADSATRSALPVLRELVGLTMHISAQIDSRLAGAGVLLAPESASRAAKRAANLPEDGDADPFTDALIKAMMTPISDRANASAYVPLIWTVPDESVPGFKFMDFSKPLDSQAKDMRDESIRRYALSADAPPELLLGMGTMNHWGAWLVQEDTVRAHLEPPLALVCDAFTTQYIRVLMSELNYDQGAIDNTVVWYDVEHLIVRPNKGDDAKTLHESGVIGDPALRDAYGYSEADAPPSSLLPEAQKMALEMVTATPTLMANPGLPIIVAQLEALLAGRPVDVPAGTVIDVGGLGGPDEPASGGDGGADGPPEGVGDPALAASGLSVQDFIGQTVIPHIVQQTQRPRVPAGR